MGQQPWHKEDIKAAVRKRGVTLTQLALSAGLAESTCRNALIRPTPSGNRAIAAFLGLPLHELWPQWFGPDGSRLTARSAAHGKRRRPVRHRQIAGRA